jgi:hypothetical protein
MLRNGLMWCLLVGGHADLSGRDIQEQEEKAEYPESRNQPEQSGPRRAAEFHLVIRSMLVVADYAHPSEVAQHNSRLESEHHNLLSAAAIPIRRCKDEREAANPTASPDFFQIPWRTGSRPAFHVRLPTLCLA